MTDELALIIGRIQIAHAWVEDDLRRVWIAIHKISLRSDPIPPNISRSLQECVSRIKLLGLSDDVVTVSMTVFEDVRSTHRERGRILHDIWLPDKSTGEYRSGKSIRLESYRDGVPVRSLLERFPSEPIGVFEACLDELRALRWRLHAVEELLLADEKTVDEDDRTDAITVAAGNFRLTADGSGIVWPA